MKTLHFLLAFSCWLAATIGVASDRPSLEPQLEPLRPLLDKTWKGAFKNSTPEKPIVDVMRWERALNGKAVRVLHSVNEGAYGGETIFRWDDKNQVVTYHYFTTAGFMRTVRRVRAVRGMRAVTREFNRRSARWMQNKLCWQLLLSIGSSGNTGERRLEQRDHELGCLRQQRLGNQGGGNRGCSQ